MTKSITTVARYLFNRLRQNGVDHVFGVPGDFTLKALDHVEAAGSRFVVNCNELNAGYAADGYARTKGLGAVFTTYGVGELSAINAVAGSYAEHTPLLHIVGLPQRSLINSGAIVHHTLGDGRTRVFGEMHKHMTLTQEFLEDPASAAEQIDNAIKMALRHSRPSYIALPCDMINQQIDSDNFDSPIGIIERLNMRKTKLVVDLLLKLIRKAQRPLLLIDRGMGMDQLRPVLNEFVERSGIPTLTMPSGASMIDHSLNNYFGVHAGPVGLIDTMPAMLSSDLVLAFGPMFSDTQTVGFSVVPDFSKTLVVGKSHIAFPKPGSFFKQIDTAEVLRELTRRLGGKVHPEKEFIATLNQPTFRSFPRLPLNELKPDLPITQDSLYLRLNRYLRSHDIILLANATPILGGRDFVLPDPSCRVIVSGLWFSIGHMLPAALGAALAQQKSTSPIPGRVVLFDGDGSFQVTAQELSTIIQHRLNVTIFIINNEGYAYERLIHNAEADYHNIAPWDYLALPSAFGAAEAIRKAKAEGEDYTVETITLRTWGDVKTFLSLEQFDNGFEGKGKRGLRLIDVKVGRTDVPPKFKKVFESAGRNLGLVWEYDVVTITRLVVMLSQKGSVADDSNLPATAQAVCNMHVTCGS